MIMICSRQGCIIGLHKKESKDSLGPCRSVCCVSPGEEDEQQANHPTQGENRFRDIYFISSFPIKWKEFLGV